MGMGPGTGTGRRRHLFLIEKQTSSLFSVWKETDYHLCPEQIAFLFCSLFEISTDLIG